MTDSLNGIRGFVARRVVAASALALFAGVAAGAAGCSEATPAASAASAGPGGAAATALPDYDPELAWRLVKEERAVLLDVRTPGEFGAGALPGAVNIPVQQFKARLAEVERLTGGDKQRAVVVYCRSGRRSGIAKEMLLAAGYDRVTNAGGIGDLR
ncbi:MAG: rhodanese-like domain-containing protein [Deltaproteobacteria bacterium HGW-Deltaproteobacteria-14]|jgi:phage shock protein E|nr:MAG: rhodanese-like domain-containing protein [Deltaproteobacteria bacterium HGW-Deltaproteobacteria-14]